MSQNRIFIPDDFQQQLQFHHHQQQMQQLHLQQQQLHHHMLAANNNRVKMPMHIGEIPSSAIFVKNLEPNVHEQELRDVFQHFVLDMEREVLVAPHFERGYAFVDLGSKEAVLDAILESKSLRGITIGNNRVVIEPSKKPVRPSGIKAILEERTRSAKKAKKKEKLSSVVAVIDDILAKGLGGLFMGNYCTSPSSSSSSSSNSNAVPTPPTTAPPPPPSSSPSPPPPPPPPLLAASTSPVVACRS